MKMDREVVAIQRIVRMFQKLELDENQQKRVTFYLVSRLTENGKDTAPTGWVGQAIDA
jgi:hypothetical protein